MKSLALAAMFAFCLRVQAQTDALEQVRRAIESHLGRPYAWGASGMKSFDCSGFVWRVAADSGLFLKRTTARKLWFPTDPAKPGDRGAFGNLAFFDDLKHVGIVTNRRSFYHAQSAKGTNLSEMNRYWRPLVVGEHRFFAAPSKQER